MGKLVGLYTDSEVVARDPRYIEALQREIGLNLVILGSGLKGGRYNLSPEVRALDPVARRGGGEPPGVQYGNDDSLLRLAIREAHRRGIRVWLLGAGWQYIGAERFPDMVSVDFSGRPVSETPEVPYAVEQYWLTFCPNHPELNEWFEAAFSDMARSYDVEGIDVTHCRYTAPAFFYGLFGCACPKCREAAEEMGYDFEGMRRGMTQLLDGLRRLDAGSVRHMARTGMGWTDLVQVLEEGVLNWFRFRAEVISRNLRRFRDAVHRATGGKVLFGGDAFPPSFAPLVGHLYRDLGESLDFVSPLLPHVEVFISSTWAAYAGLLCSWVPGLGEREALRSVYCLFGYGDMAGLPEAIEDLGVGGPDGEYRCLPLKDILVRELYKARAFISGVSYPVVKGRLWPPAVIRDAVESAEDMGHEGIIFQGTSGLVEYPGRT